MIEIIAEELSEIDERVVGDIALRRLLLDTYKMGVEKGPQGWIDDVLAFRRPWRFDLSQIHCRTLIWHGNDDRFSPVEHSEFLYRKIGTRHSYKELKKERGIGHFGAVDVLPAILAWVLDGVDISPEQPRAVERLRTVLQDRSRDRQLAQKVAL